MADLPTVTVVVEATETTVNRATVTTTSYLSYGAYTYSTVSATSDVSYTHTTYSTTQLGRSGSAKSTYNAQVGGIAACLAFSAFGLVLFLFLCKHYNQARNDRRLWLRRPIPRILVVHPGPTVMTQVHVGGTNVVGVGGGGGGGGGAAYGGAPYAEASYGNAAHGNAAHGTAPPAYGH